MGDGEVAMALDPSPALLACMIQMPRSVDEQLMRTISEGGKAFGTAMSEFKDTPTAEGIRKVIACMRSGLSAEAQQ